MLLRIFRWFASNLGLLLLAFLLALVVWVAAVLASDPNEERTYIRQLEVVGQDPRVILTSDIPAQARITLEAPRSILDEITNTPSLLSAWIDLTGLGAGAYNVDTKVRWERDPVRLVRTEPATVSVNLEAEIEKTFPVSLVIEGEAALGYKKGTEFVDPQEVVISGRESQVNRVSQVRATLDIAGSGETIKASVPVAALDEDGNPVTDITISPRVVTVTQPISLLGGYKNVVVKVVTTGQIADGYRLTNLSVTPLTVTVFSDNPQRINQLPGYVETEPVDLTNLSEDTEIRVDLSLPDGISLVGEQSVLVQISVAPIEGSLTISLPIEAMGLSPTFSATFSPPSVDVLVFGPLPVLDTLTQDSFRAIVDLTGLEPGIYQVPVVIDLVPDQVRIESILPETVEATISLVPTATPTPSP
jgi:YbbR domain-containing protein